MFLIRKMRVPFYNADGATSGAGQATVEPGAATTPTEIEIDGVKYTPEQLKELISKGNDYTKKTQEVAKQRKELEAAQAEIQKLVPYKDFIERLDVDPGLQQQVVTAVQGYYQRVQQGQAPTQAQMDVIKKAAADPDTGDETQQMLEDLKLDMELNKLKSKYDDFDENAVLEYADENKIENLEHAYKLLTYEQAQQKAAKKALEDAKKGAAAPRTQTGSAGSAPSAARTPPKTFGEAKNAALEYMRAMRGGQ